MKPSFSSTVLGLASLCAFVACHDGAASTGRAAQGAEDQSPAARWSVVLPWGSGAGEVGLRPTRPDWPGAGVAAVAPAPRGGAYLLDRINQRVAWAGDKGARPITSAPADADDLVAAPGGAFLLHSSLRARVFVHEDVSVVGELAIDRNLRELTAFSLSDQRRVFAHNAHQETLPLGSPAAPSTLAATYHQKRKGSYLLGDGSGVSVRLADGRPELLVLSNEGRARVTARHLLSERVLAARLVGLAGDIACLRLEIAAPGERFAVARRAVCHDVRTGARVLDQALGVPGLHLPKRELAVGDAPARLLFIRPEAKGLRVFQWPLSAPLGVPR